MNRLLIQGAALLLLVPTLFAQEGKPDPKVRKPDQPAVEQAAKPAVPQVSGGYAPGATVDGALVLKDLKGKEVKLSDFQGKVTVVDFWSITCPISKGWESRLKALAEVYAKKDVHFVAIDSNKTEHGDLDKITEYVEQTKVPYTILVDAKNVVADKFGATHTPHVFLLDAKGVVKYVGAIDDDQSGKNVKTEYLRAALDAVLAGKEPATTKTQAKGCSIKRVPAEAPKAEPDPKKDGEPKGK